MSNEQYDIYFKGEPEEGIKISIAKLNFAKIFKMDEAKTEQFFSGKTVRLKKTLDRNAAKKYQSTLNKAGIKVYIRISTYSSEHSSAQPETKSALQLLPAGADILRQEERPEIPVRNIDTSAMNATSDFSRLADEPDFCGAVPDTSHLADEKDFERLVEPKKITAERPNIDHINLAE